MTDLPPIANFISNCLLILLVITFIYALNIRFNTKESPNDNEPNFHDEQKNMKNYASINIALEPQEDQKPRLRQNI